MTSRSSALRERISSSGYSTNDQSVDASTAVCFEICRGQTQFPRRPLTADRFLIGSGAHCDLRLGGDDIPALHSLVLRDAQGVLIEAIASAPPLRINGCVQETARLQGGDQIEIGSFQFRVEASEGRDAASVVASEKTTPDNTPGACDATSEVKQPTEMSATELVNQIEKEQTVVEEFESREKMGADALMQEIIQRAAEAARTVPQAFAEAARRRDAVGRESVSSEEKTLFPQQDSEAATRQALLNDIETLLDRVHLYERELERRAQRLTERESSYTEAALALLEGQQKLETQLEQLTKELTQLQQSSSSRQPAAFQPVAQLRKAV